MVTAFYLCLSLGSNEGRAQPSASERAATAEARAYALLDGGNLDAAEASFRAALALYDEANAQLYSEGLSEEQKTALALMGRLRRVPTLSGLARTLDLAGRMMEAGETLDTALQVQRKSTNPDKSVLKDLLVMRARWHIQDGRLHLAKPLLDEALWAFPKDTVADLLANTYSGRIMATIGQPALAKIHYGDAAKLAEKLAPERKGVALTLRIFELSSGIDFSLHDIEAAQFETLVEQAHAAAGPSSDLHLMALQLRAHYHGVTGNYEEAEAASRAFLDFALSADKPSAGNEAEALSLLADALAGQGRGDLAIPLRERALAHYAARDDPGAPGLAFRVPYARASLLQLLANEWADDKTIEAVLNETVAELTTHGERLKAYAVAEKTIPYRVFERLAEIMAMLGEVAQANGAPASDLLKLTTLPEDIAAQLNGRRGLRARYTIHGIRASILLAENRLEEAEAEIQLARHTLLNAVGDRGFSDWALHEAQFSNLYFRKGDAFTGMSTLHNATEAAILAMTAGNGGPRRTSSLDRQRFRDLFVRYVHRLWDREQRILGVALTDGKARVLKLPADPGETDWVTRSEGFDAAFRAAQWSQLSAASEALAKLAARFAARGGALGGLIRRRQDLIEDRQQLDSGILALLGLPPDKRPQDTDLDALSGRLREVEAELAAIDREITKDFPGFTQLTKPSAVSIDDAAAILRPGEALLMYLVDEERVYGWLLRPDRLVWTALDVNRWDLIEGILLLREGLDPTTPARSATRNKGQFVASGPPFDRYVAHDLYLRLIAPFEPHLQGITHLLYSPDGALDSLPLSVLVTERPDARYAAKEADNAGTAWFVRRLATTTVPGAGSLRAFRGRTFERHGKGFIGVGDPVLEGMEGDARNVGLARYFRSGGADVDQLRTLAPLPETADELKNLAASFDGEEVRLFLGPEAREPLLRAGGLESGRIIAFATHGLIAGELTGLAEPALVLTPPERARPDDDGLLTASEITQLDLATDWVLLSACNTAAGDGSPGAEGLSGLARAFFYAGSPSLLVSHWPVNSKAAVRLTTGTFAELAQTPGMRRSEALRRSILSMIDGQEGEMFSHPAMWAPFVVVGEGGPLKPRDLGR